VVRDQPGQPQPAVALAAAAAHLEALDPAGLLA
jgi:hypothetical protein